jgi:acyl-CoA reductase-like NAD-dependent aldehyde dehydrogenase
VISDTSSHAQDAIFGPVLLGMSFEDADELVRTARHAIDGLGTANRSGDPANSLLVHRAVRVSVDLD